MRHRVAGRKLGRKSAHRRALFSNLATALILHDRIETTLPKAKELRPVAEGLVTLGKRQDLHARRRAARIVRDRRALSRLFAELAPRFADRHGGYTRILKLGYRHGDAAPMAVIEYLDASESAPVHEKDRGKGSGKGEAASRHKASEKGVRHASAAKEQEQKARLSARASKQQPRRASPAHKATRSGEK